MESLGNNHDENLAGIVFVMLALTREILSMPDINSDGIYEDLPTLIDGAEWGVVEFTDDTAQFKGNPYRIGGSTVYKPTISCKVPKLDPTLSAFVDKYIQAGFVMVVRERNGWAFLIGTKEQPARLSVKEIENGDKIGDYNGVQIDMYAYSRYPVRYCATTVDPPDGADRIKAYSLLSNTEARVIPVYNSDSEQGYFVGEYVIHNDVIVKCTTNTSGVFNPDHWTVLGSAFDPENIDTFLRFTSDYKWIGKRLMFTDSATSTVAIVFSEASIYMVIGDNSNYSGIQVRPDGTINLRAVNGGNSGTVNEINMNSSRTIYDKMIRYASVLTPSDDKDIVPKKWVDDIVAIALQDAIDYTDQNFNDIISTKGAANGIVPLNGVMKIDASYLPSYVDDVVEYANAGLFPSTGESGKIYIAIDTNFQYRWSGSAYVQITSASAVWGAISGSLASQLDLQAALNSKADSSALANYILSSAISNLLTVTSAGSVLDARQGKVLKDLIDALTITVTTQDKLFKGLNIYFTSGALIAKYYFRSASTITFNYRSSSISTVQYSTNAGSSYTTLASGTVSVSISANTEVWFAITYVTPTANSEGILSIDGTIN